MTRLSREDPVREPGTKRPLFAMATRYAGGKNVGEDYESIARGMKSVVGRRATPEARQREDYPQLRSRIITDAVIAHRNNRELYSHVMGYPPEYALQGNALLRHFAREAARQERLSNEGID